MTSPTYLTFGATGGMGQTLGGRPSKRGASLLIGGRVVSTNPGSTLLLVRAPAKAMRGHWTRSA
jgi:hypothetical protein